MGKKKHAPIEDLRRAKKVADQILVDKGIILSNEQSAIARILNSKDGPILPGIPVYLPQAWTVNATKHALYSLSRWWELETRDKPDKVENISEFITFVIQKLAAEDREIRTLMLESANKGEYNIKFLHERDAVNGIAKFLVDSFAVSIVVKSNSSVSEYIEWFLRWTESLLKEWAPNMRQIDARPIDESKPESQIIH